MGHGRFGVFYVLRFGCRRVTGGDSSGIGHSDGRCPVPSAASWALTFSYIRVYTHMLVFLGFFITTVAVPAVVMLDTGSN